jgi:hypothetical protein
MGFNERVFFMEAQLDRIEDLIDAEQQQKKKEKELDLDDLRDQTKALSLPGIYISSSGSSWSSSSGSEAEKGISMMAKYFQLVEMLERLKAEYGY